jgi:fatty-acyl-CoA synthase
MIGYKLTVNAAHFPDATAIVFGARRYTYAELNERACRLANGLAAMGIRRGDRVATLLHNCNQFVEALFATAKLGAVFVPINFRLVAREVGQQLDGCEPRVLLAGEAFTDVLAELGARASFPPHVLRVNDRPDAEAQESGDYENLLAGHPATEPGVDVGADDVLLLIHTSGTTGVPKGAMWTHGTTFLSAAAKIIDFALAPSDATVVFGPLFHAGPLADLALPLLLRGGKLVIGPSRQFAPEHLLRAIADEGATVVTVYPTMWRRVLTAFPDVSDFDLTALRLLFTGGETIPVPVLKGVYALFPGVGFVNTYGSTETGPITTFLAPHERLRKIGSIGKEAFGVEIRIADEQGRPLEPGQVGEILVRGPFVCRGYWNRPEATAESSRNGWWHTGDLARRDEEGFVYIAGRSKDMIKSGTENIYPVEIERVIAMLDGVAEVGVVGVPDDEWGEAVAAFVVKAPGASLAAAEIIEHCREHLASYKKPRHVRFVDSLPRTTVNKISRNELKAAFTRN